MITPCGSCVRRVLQYVGIPLALLFLLDVLVVLGYVYFDQQWLALQNLPLSIGAGVVGVILGFRNSSCYARWWEARTLWGRIVNYSRCVGAAGRHLHLGR